MKRYLLDTGAAGDYLARRKNVFSRAKEEVARGNRVGICLPVLGELYYGIELSASREKNLQRLLRDLPIAAIALSLGNCTVVSGDSDLSAVPGLTVESWAG